MATSISSTPDKQKSKRNRLKKREIIFEWEGLDRAGRPASGRIIDLSASSARFRLRQMGFAPRKIHKRPLFTRLMEAISSPIKSKDVAQFCRQIASMASAGLPIAQALDVVAQDRSNPSLADMCTTLRTEVESGNTLANALDQFPRYFDSLFVNLVAAGEQSGTLDRVLRDLAQLLEKTQQMRAKVRSAMTYPVMVILVAVILVIVMMTFVIPKFQEMYSGYNAALPALTQVVINMSNFTREHFLWILGIPIILYVLFSFARRRSSRFHFFIDRITLKIPVLGSILVNSTVARFAHTLSTMFTAGVPIVEVLNTVASVTTNDVYRAAIEKMSQETADGDPLQESMLSKQIFPHMAVQMIGIGEQTGSLDDMASRVADFYSEEVDTAVNNLSNMVEPLLMIVIGGIVGVLLVAMYLPIFQMANIVE